MAIMSMSLNNEIGRITIIGDIDMFASKQLKQDLWNAIQNKKITHLDLDFQDVGYIDSTGIGTMMSFIKMMRQSGVKVYVINISGRIEITLSLAGLIKFFCGEQDAEI